MIEVIMKDIWMKNKTSTLGDILKYLIDTENNSLKIFVEKYIKPEEAVNSQTRFKFIDVYNKIIYLTWEVIITGKLTPSQLLNQLEFKYQWTIGWKDQQIEIVSRQMSWDRSSELELNIRRVLTRQVNIPISTFLEEEEDE